MTKLLRIDSSARASGSYSRRLADNFETCWRETHPGGSVIVRDITEHPVTHISDTTITGFYTPLEQQTQELKNALKLSDDLVGELKSADEILISAPIYNFSIPSALKAWIDQIVRPGHTFSYDGKTFSGLLAGKKIYFCLAYGGQGYIQGPMSAMDFLKPYLQAVFGFMGLGSMEFFVVEGTTTNPGALAEKMNQAQEKIKITLGK